MSDKLDSPSGQGRVAGAGLGTGYIGALSLIPESHHWLRDLLVLAAPILTVVTAVIWIFVVDWAMKKALKWHLTGAIRDAEEIRNELQADGSSLPQDIENAKQAVNNLKRLRVDAITQSVAAIRAKLKELRQ